MASITPAQKAAHNFGFMGMINRVAGFLGPVLFSTLSVMVDTKAGFLSLVILALVGMVIMTLVDFEKGRRFWEYEDVQEKKDADTA